MQPSTRYDFIFTGAGCAALSLLMRMIRSGKFNDKKILLIDKEPKNKNDRTWCFWEKGTGFFEEIVYKKWSKLSVLNHEDSLNFDIHPCQYKMIRGIDFYNYCFSEIARHPNIEIMYGTVSKVYKHQEGITVYIDDKVLELDDATVFNSFFKKEAGGENPSGEINLLQHFKGWVIETSSPAFDPARAVFMDFRVHQYSGTSFAYLLPFSFTKALVEYTVFSETVLTQQAYDDELKKYIRDILQIPSYKIEEEEFGIIPMTTRKLEFYNQSVYHLGTAGGQTKASSGYTFQFIQKQAERIMDYLLRNKALLEIPQTPVRFLFYDRVLLDVLYNRRASGKNIFIRMFKKNNPVSVLRFLDNESTLAEELKIISTLPTLPFLKAAWNQM